MASIDQARDAKAALKAALAGRDGVTGIGLTRAPVDDGQGGAPVADARTEGGADSEERWCLQVNVVDADASGDVPHEVDGVAVVVRVTGHVGAG